MEAIGDCRTHAIAPTTARTTPRGGFKCKWRVFANRRAEGSA